MESAARRGRFASLRADRVDRVLGPDLAQLADAGKAFAAVLPEVEAEARQLALRPGVVDVARWVATATHGFRRRSLVASHADFARLLRRSRRTAGTVVRAAIEAGLIEQQPWFERAVCRCGDQSCYREDDGHGRVLTHQELTAGLKQRPRAVEVEPHYRPGKRLRCLLLTRETRRFRAAVEERAAAAASTGGSQVGNDCQPADQRSPDSDSGIKVGRCRGRKLSEQGTFRASDDEVAELEALAARYEARARAEGFWRTDPWRPEAPEGGDS